MFLPMQWRTLALFSALLSSYGSHLSIASAQQTSTTNSSQTPTLRANTRMVVVDVVATDSKGQPTPDLKAEDFTVFEDGKPQTISAFNYERTGSNITVSTQVQLPPSVVTNAPKFQSNARDIILFDSINGEFS